MSMTLPTDNPQRSLTHAQPDNLPHIGICSPAGQDKFFLEVGVPVATRTTPPPKLNESEQAAFIEKVKALAPKYRTELLREA
jgi:hypothetical protein